MPAGPDLETLLANWWGGGVQCFAWTAIADAANVIVGGNPLYQISDFLAMYPKFGTQPQSISQILIANAGSGYAVNDVVTVIQPGGAGGNLIVGTVDLTGAIQTFQDITTQVGGGYRVANNLATTSSGAGVGAVVNIVAISAYTSGINLPEIIVQAYLNLANLSLSMNRWQGTWLLAMGLFIAHFLTLYLRSEGNPGTTAQQVAASGLEKGLTVSKAAGDVSQGLQPLSDLEGWAAWRETTYGVQLATFAKIIGMPNSMYIY